MAAICHSLLPVFLPLLDLKVFEFIGIIPDILFLVILFSPMNLLIMPTILTFISPESYHQSPM